MITLKAGATLYRSITWTADGVPIDLTGHTVTAQVRRVGDAPDDEPTGTLTCTVDPDQEANPGVFTIEATSSETATWPIAKLICDVRRETEDEVAFTETFEIQVQRPVTR